MRLSRRLAAKTFIIGVAFALLSGCSAFKLGYDNGPALASWWLDRYLDLNRTQSAALRPELERWFEWHRATQLPDYAKLLAGWRERAAGKLGADEICAIGDTVLERVETAWQRAMPAAARLLPSITDAQWKHLEQRFAEENAKRREEHAQPDRAERLKAATERALERAEESYGRLSPAQRTLLAEAAAASPVQPERWLADRAQRQREFVAALRALQREPDAARRTEGLRRAVQRLQEPADGGYAQTRERWLRHNCETAARLHESTTREQRAHLQERLRSWEEDVRALASRPAPVPRDAAL